MRSATTGGRRVTRGRSLRGNVRGAHGDVFSGVSHTIMNGSGISSRILSNVRSTLVTSSVKISAALGVVSVLRSEMTHSGCVGTTRLRSVLGRRVYSLLGIGRDNSRPTAFSFSGGPCIVVMIKIGKIKGAAAVNGLTTGLGTTNGGMVIKTTSAFHTTTMSRLIM